MSTQTPPARRPDAFDDASRRRLVETNGIDIITEAERTGKPSDLFWPWFAANVSVFGISYAAFVLDPDENNIELVYHGEGKRSSKDVTITF